VVWKRSLWAPGCFPTAGNLVSAGTAPSIEFGRAGWAQVSEIIQPFLFPNFPRIKDLRGFFLFNGIFYSCIVRVGLSQNVSTNCPDFFADSRSANA
jgi:hypothetical protein